MMVEASTRPTMAWEATLKCLLNRLSITRANRKATSAMPSSSGITVPSCSRPTSSMMLLYRPMKIRMELLERPGTIRLKPQMRPEIRAQTGVRVRFMLPVPSNMMRKAKSPAKVRPRAVISAAGLRPWLRAVFSREGTVPRIRPTNRLMG